MTTITENKPAADAGSAPPSPSLAFTVDGATLARAAKAVSSAADLRSTAPALTCVAIDAHVTGRVELWATDLDVRISRTINAAVNSAGGTAVSARTLADLTAALAPAMVDLRLLDIGLVVETNETRARLHSIPFEDMPTHVIAMCQRMFQMPAADLLRLFEAVAHCISTEETRYYLNGIFLQRRGTVLKAVATDGHKLAVASITTPVDGDHAALDKGVIIPRPVVKHLLRLLSMVPGTVPVSIEIAQQQGGGPFSLVFGWEHDGETSEVSAKAIDGTYPDYDKVIPVANDKEFIIYRSMLRRALRTLAPAVTRLEKGIKLMLDESVLMIRATSIDIGELTTRVNVISTSKAEVGVNAFYLASVMDAFDCDAVIVRLIDAAQPITLQPAHDGRPADQQDRVSLFQVLMPMRV